MFTVWCSIIVVPAICSRFGPLFTLWPRSGATYNGKLGVYCTQTIRNWLFVLTSRCANDEYIGIHYSVIIQTMDVQLVITTDGRHSYGIFGYDHFDWTSNSQRRRTPVIGYSDRNDLDQQQHYFKRFSMRSREYWSLDERVGNSGNVASIHPSIRSIIFLIKMLIQLGSQKMWTTKRERIAY